MSAAKKKVSDDITKDMPIGKVVMEHPETVDIFMNHGLHCVGCAAAYFENIAQGCEAHGIDADILISDLNKVVKKKK